MEKVNKVKDCYTCPYGGGLGGAGNGLCPHPQWKKPEYRDRDPRVSGYRPLKDCPLKQDPIIEIYQADF